MRKLESSYGKIPLQSEIFYCYSQVDEIKNWKQRFDTMSKDLYIARESHRVADERVCHSTK